ncbi:MAG: two-component regulator propeller domain-containing protein [Candidatus Pseudobacter hemicellulosilyticus]|uniref:histidine kinase n=1 Tax=Candidatus Pseudobacter hemicellulosilyticus TaxID=3121375 RepID=A0AAJ5WQK3_9BACT|nr:MAG: two-component regulator propeller domain-containing protein [Pseudobacter sp.]
MIQLSKRLPGFTTSLALKTLLLLHLSLFSNAQTIYFRHYEIEDGLSNNTIITSLQDRDGFMWFGTSDGLNRFDGYGFKLFSMHPDPATGNAGTAIFHLYLDDTGTLWVGTVKGLYYYNKEDESFTRLPHTQGQVVRTIQGDANNNIWFVEGPTLYRYDTRLKKINAYPSTELQHITTLFRSADSTLWLGCANGVLASYQPSTQQFQTYSSPQLSRNANTIETICQASDSTLLIGTSLTGLKRFDTRHRQWTTIALQPRSQERLYIRSVLQASHDEFWIGTETGLFILNCRTDSIRHLHKVTGDKYALTDNAIYSLCKDKEGGIWVGTYFGGINYFPNHSMPFEKYFPKPDENSIRGSVVREIIQDRHGLLWIGTEDKGLTRFDPVRKTFTNFNDKQDGFLDIPTNIHGLLVDQDKLYIGSFENGLYVMDIPSRTIQQHHVAYANNGLNSNYINILYRSAQGNIYVCTSSGLYDFDPRKKFFRQLEGLPANNFYSAILQDSKGTIWVGTHESGVYAIENGQTRKLTLPFNGKQLFNDTKIVNFSEDREGHLWISTESGLYRISLTDQQVTAYNTESGLPSNIVYSTVQDAYGNIWATTSMGLAYLDLINNVFRIFRQTDGLLTNQFNHRSAFRDSTGNIYFGGLKGFIRFNPANYFVSNYVPPIFFTRLQVFNKEVSANSLYTFSDNYNLNSDHFSLPHNRSTFSLDFAALSYTSPENIEYAYMLAGVDNQWNFIGKDRRIHFNNLSPGSYTIRIKSTNSNGLWMPNEKSFVISVEPPFWKTRLAYTVYALLLATLLFATARYFHLRQKEKQRRRMELFSLNKERELNQHKIDFFTRVAHEIRTPLTLIKAPMDKIIRQSQSMPDLQHEISVMNKNTDRLLTVANQLLDFQKVESDSFMLHTEARDIVDVIRELFDNFQPKADQKSIHYSLLANPPAITCTVDEEGFIKIISNLLDNAIKYSNEFLLLDISLEEPSATEQETAVIKVYNDGDIIPENERKYIFDAFYRSGNKRLIESTGLGLSLARSIALLHKGSLEYSTDGKHNIFTLRLPALPADKNG